MSLQYLTNINPLPAMPSNLGFDGNALWVSINNGDETGYLLKFGT